MTHRTLSNKIRSILFSTLVLSACLHTPAHAAPDEDLQTLGMFYEGKDLVASATRNPKPISQTAENITVITAADIEMMGAHTLPDVLNNISGLLTFDRGGLGTFGGFSIQGADFFHVLVLLDGVTLNFLGVALTDIAPIPVQNIERIEIVKGPGSSAWGSALGGVINIVTKSPSDHGKVGGAVSFSAGDRGTRDSRGELSGTVGPLGYYMYAGNLVSGGFRPHTALDLTNLYTKLRLDLPEGGNLQWTFAYTWQSGENGQSDVFLLSQTDRKKNFLSTLTLNQPLNANTDLDVSLRTASKRFDDLSVDLSTGMPNPDNLTRESTLGGSAKLIRRDGINSLVAGADFDHVEYDDGTITLKSDKWGVFVNDTLSVGKFAVTPGIRYDRMPQVGDFVSPSLGVAWNLNEQTTLRVYTARGYSLPVMLPYWPQGKVITVQAGFETTQLPSLWLKTSFFWNQLETGVFGSATPDKEKKQGIELEAKTVPLFNTSLSVGYTFIDAKDRNTGETLRDIASQIVKMGLLYDDKRCLRGALFGRYVWWNGSPGNFTKDKAIIWDLNLAKKVLTVHDTALELFINAHNIFNGAQFNTVEGFENARRWVEGGIRFNF